MVCPPTTLIIGCGAIARELAAVMRINAWSHATVKCLPANLHNRPEKIAPAVDALIREHGEQFDRIAVAYADCGTGGALDKVLAEHDVDRLPGAHCYAFFAGSGTFAQLHEEEPGTFYLTDFLARHFERLILDELGLNRHPELREMMFGNYRRIVYLAQSDDANCLARAQLAARRLDLELHIRRVGLAPFQFALTQMRGVKPWPN